MELWIRSQDKTTLIRSYEIYIAEHSNSYVIRAKRTSHILGAYKTIDRALEVLDEIQKLLQPQTIINYESKLEFHPECTVQNIVKTIPKTEIKELSTYVYEIPEE